MGSDSTLVAPVTLGNGSYVAAGIVHYRGCAGRCASVGAGKTDDKGRMDPTAE